MAITKMRFYRAARTDFAAVGSKTGFALKRVSRTAGRQKHPAWRATRSSYRCVADYLEDLAVLLCAASSSNRLANCLSSHSRASAAAVRQVGVWSLRQGKRALRSIVAIDRNS